MSHLLRDEPDLELVRAEHVTNQQVIGSVVAALGRSAGRFARFTNNQFVGLQQAEQLDGGALPATRRTGNEGDFGHIRRHGDSYAAERLNALSQGVYDHSLFHVV